jgi:hypothetical protein
VQVKCWDDTSPRGPRQLSRLQRSDISVTRWLGTDPAAGSQHTEFPTESIPFAVCPFGEGNVLGTRRATGYAAANEIASGTTQSLDIADLSNRVHSRPGGSDVGNTLYVDCYFIGRAFWDNGFSDDGTRISRRVGCAPFVMPVPNVRGSVNLSGA